jgi:glycosyltransferase involved in cell wall biosynthesis
VTPGTDAPPSLSSALHGFAVGCTDASYEWSPAVGWIPAGALAPHPVQITARMRAGDIGDVAPISSALQMSSEVRLFIGVDPRDGNEAQAGLARARELLEARGATLFWIDDRLGRWWRDTEDRELLSGALYACVGFDPLSIAAVAHNGDLGGASRAHVEMAVELQRRGHLVHTLTPRWSARTLPTVLREAGVATADHHCRWWASPDPNDDWTAAGAGVTELTAQLAEINPVLVITETAVLPGGALAARDAGLPHVWMLHERIDPGYGLHPPCSPSDLGAAIDELSEAVIVNSRFVAEYFFEDPDDRRVAAPISVKEFDRLVASSSQAEAATEAEAARDSAASAPERPFTVAAIGQVAEAKGLIDLVDAVRILADQGYRVRVRVFGSGDPAAMAALRAAISRRDLADEFVLEGHRGDALEALQECDAVAAPSWAEAFGRVPVEAVACGCPVVYAAAGGMTEFMVDGVSGLAFEARNPHALANTIKRLIDDPGIRETLVTSGRVHLRSWLADHDAADAVVELGGALLARPDRPTTWLASAGISLRRADATDCAAQLDLLPAWQQAGIAPSLAVFQGSRVRGLSLQRRLDSWVGSPGRRRRRLVTAAAKAAGIGARGLSDRVRAALLVSGEDPSLDPWVVDGMLDEPWYREVHGLPPSVDALLEFARRGLMADEAPNEFIDPGWYLDRNPDVAGAGVGAVRHYLTQGCFEGRAPGPDFDPERYLSHNPDVVGSDMPPLVHYLRYGRAEGRRLW